MSQATSFNAFHYYYLTTFHYGLIPTNVFHSTPSCSCLLCICNPTQQYALEFAQDLIFSWNTRSPNLRSDFYLHLRFNLPWCLGSVGPSFHESTSPDQIWARRVHAVHAGSNSRSATFRIWIWSQAPRDSVPAQKLVNLYCHISLVGQHGQ